MRLFKHMIIVGLVGITFSCNAETGPTPGQNNFSLASLNWLVGHWKGECFDGVGEEIWSEPVGGAMMGMFRFIKNGKPDFYEFCHLIENDGEVELRLKHFTANMVGWEEKEDFVSWKLLEVTPKKAVFEALTMELVADNELVMYLDIAYKADSVVTETFNFKRNL